MKELDLPEGLTEEEKERIKNEFANNIADKINNPIDHKAIPKANA